MTGKFNAMSTNTAFLLCTILAASINSDAAGEFPFYDGGIHSITNDQPPTTDALWLGDSAANTLLQIQTNAVVEVGRVNMVGHDNVVTNRLVLEDNSRLVAGSTTFTTTNAASLIVGSDADEGVPSIAMDNAARIEAENLYMGAEANDSGSIRLEGEDTTLAISGTASVGAAGSENTIDISGGATFKVEGTLDLGSATTSNNVISAGNGGTLFVGSVTDINVIGFESQTNQIVIKDGGTLEVGGDLDTEDLKDRGIVLNQDADVAVNGELSAKDFAIENIKGIGLNIVLNTSNSLWNVTDSRGASVGLDTDGNSLTLTNGANVSVATTLRVGRNASNNKLNVLGGSLLSVGGTNHVGHSGDNNSMTVNDATFNADTVILGYNSSADGNQLLIEKNANVTITNSLIVGNLGTENKYLQSGGTNAILGDLIIGQNNKATGNNATVSGTNSLLTANRIIVGNEGASSWLLLEDGGQIETAVLAIGVNTNNNSVEITGSNSVLTVDTDLTVGENGEDNTLTINGGTANIGNDLIVGANSNNNSVVVSGTNSTLNIAARLYVGDSSSTNILTVQAGGEVNAGGVNIGSDTNNISTDNALLITGSDSLMSVSNNLVIGSDVGTNNTVAVENGGTLFVGGTISEVGGSNNVLNVNHNGTLHTLDWDFSTISSNIFLNSGSTLELDGIFSGTNQLDGGLELALNGAPATTNWNTGTNVLYIGYETDGNTLTIKEGGLATTSTNLIVGRSSGSINNTLSATGLSSRVEVGNNLIVGNPGSSNNGLEILGGGQVNVANDFILGSASDNNTGLLEGFTGTNSTLNVTGNLTIGRNGAFNELQISSNAVVTVDGNMTVGKSGTNNRYFQTGGTNTVAGEFIIGETEDSTGKTISGQTDTTGNLGSVGTNATLDIQQNLTVGKNGGGSILLIHDGGTVNVAGDAVIGEASDDNYIFLQPDDPDSRFNVLGDLVVSEEGGNNRFAVYGGTANIDGNLYLGASTNEHAQKNYIHLETTNAVLNVANAIYIGASNSLNTLDIVDGATASAQDLFIGASADASDNVVTVTGSNSTLNVWNDLFIGMETNIYGNNEFRVLEAATAHIGGNLSLSSKSLLKIDYDAQVVVDGDYSQDESSVLALGISTNYAGTNLVVGGTASFAKNATIAVFDDETIVGTTNDFSRALVTSTNLVIDGQEASQILLNDSITNLIDIANDLLDINLIVSNNTIWVDSITRLSLASTSGLEDGTQLANVADEIDFMADAGGSNNVAITMRDFMDTEMDTDGRNKAFHDYYGEKASSAPMHNVINQGLGGIADQLTVRGDNTRTRTGTESAPAGAEGPHTQNQELQGWIAGYGSWADHSAADGFDAYDANLSGFIIGMDLAVSQNILVGLAGGSNSGSVDKDNGASGDTKTTYGSLYASVGAQDWFLDGSVIYGSSSIDQTLGDVFDTTASYDAQNIAFYLGGGKEIVGNYLIVTPQASLLANYYKQDAYDEKSSVMARSVDSFDALYLQSSLGCNLGFYMAMGEITFKPEIRAHWLHEFNANEEDLSYTLLGGTGGLYNMVLQAPVADVLKLGAGVAAKMGEYLEIRADLDTQWASDYSDYTLLGSLRYQF